MSGIRRIVAALILLAAALLGSQPVQATDATAQLLLGNPSGAVADAAYPTNELIAREQYVVGYHRDRGIPTWVSWHLEAADLGPADRRMGDFITDTALPTGWYRATHRDYTNTGYDRGHMTPSADRTATDADNDATFILTNVLPQAPQHNRGLWAQLEAATRAEVTAGNEVYVIAGGAGTQGTLAEGQVTIPASLWKVLVILPAGTGDDLARITATTRVVAVWTPNDETVVGTRWQDYPVSIRCIEQRTGLDLLSAVADDMEAVLAGAPCVAVPAVMVYMPLVVVAGDGM